MSFLYLVAAIAIGLVLLEALNRLVKGINKRSSVSVTFEEAVVPWMMRGFDGTRAVIFHQPSGTLIQVIKGLHPRAALNGVVNMRVTRGRVSNPGAYNLEWGWKPSWGGCTAVPFWRLPSPKAMILDEEVECGASLRAVRQVLERMMDEAFGQELNHDFYYWLEQGYSSFLMGRFDDFG